MNSIKLWDIDSNYIYYNNLNEFLLENDLEWFEVKDSFKINDKVTSSLEAKCLEDKTPLIYTDINHPICTDKYNIFINPLYYEKNKARINETTKNTILRSKKNIIKIPSLIFDNEFFNKLVTNKSKCSLIFDDILLSELQIEKLKSAHISAFNGNVKISESHIIGDYSLNNVSDSKILQISIDKMTEVEVSNFKYIKDGTLLNIEFSDYDKLNKLIKYINYINKKIIIRITIDSISNALSIEDKGNIIVNYLNADYTLKDLREMNEKINIIIDDIINSKMSMFEKDIAIYNYVKSLKEHNDSLFIELLNRVGIQYIASIDNNLLRLIVNITDAKYNINGYFVSDLSFNSCLNFSNSVSSFDDLSLVTVLNFADFCDKINCVLNKDLKENLEKERKNDFKYFDVPDKENLIYTTALLNTYKGLCSNLMFVLKKLDYHKYEEYQNVEFNNEEAYIKYLTEIGKYLALKNKGGISKETIDRADSAVLELQNCKYKEVIKEADLNALYSNLLKT
mgnify:FL=1